jgi:murein DD-endopeptidase MepM/ murein hydrolase activator NlpD
MRKKHVLFTVILISGLFMAFSASAEEFSSSTSGLINSLGEGDISSGQKAAGSTAAPEVTNEAAKSATEAAKSSSSGAAGRISEPESGENSSLFGGVMPAIGKITSYFGYRIHPIKKKKKLHEGIDISLKTGSTLYALGDGVVVESKIATGHGLTILVRHEIAGKVYYTRYAHLSKKCKAGTLVSKGKPIEGAKSGNTGWSTGAHLHFEVLDENHNPLDPMTFINGSKKPADSGNI